MKERKKVAEEWVVNVQDAITFPPLFSGVSRNRGFDRAGGDVSSESRDTRHTWSGPKSEGDAKAIETPKKTKVVKGKKGRMEGRPYEKSPNGLSAGVVGALG